jgi:CRISPR-associated protein Cas5t
MLLSLVGERYRHAHEGVRLAFAFRDLPSVAINLRKLSRYKYGVASKQESLGNQPDYIETLCGIEFLCWVDSSEERGTAADSLERRLCHALQQPESVTRYGVVSLGLSDDLVNEVSIWQRAVGEWRRLLPDKAGSMELPVWTDHLGSAKTRWSRFNLEEDAREIQSTPGCEDWSWTIIQHP